MSTFVVIGSNSFSGAHFVRELLARGEDVIGMSRSPEPHRVFLPYRWGAYPGRFVFQQLDLNHDADAMAEVIAAERAPYVVNFASQSMVAQSWDNPEHWFQTNVVSTIHLHERLRRIETLERYVHVSTPEVYGSCSGLVGEDARLNPSTPYAVSRAAADMSLLTYWKRYDFPVVFTRAANVYGAGQQLYRIIPRAILFGRIGAKLQLQGGGTSVRAFIDAADVAVATHCVATRGKLGEVYHLSTARHISIRGLVEEICAQLGIAFSDLVEDAASRPGHDPAYLLDTAKARAELDWSPRIELEEGIAATVRWVDENLAELRDQSFDYVHKP